MNRAEYHVMIDQDDEGELVFNLTQPSGILEMIVVAGHLAHWSFLSAPLPGWAFIVHVYHFSSAVPQGENLEEINRRAVLCVLKQTLGEDADPSDA